MTWAKQVASALGYIFYSYLLTHYNLNFVSSHGCHWLQVFCCNIDSSFFFIEKHRTHSYFMEDIMCMVLYRKILESHFILRSTLYTIRVLNNVHTGCYASNNSNLSTQSWVFVWITNYYFNIWWIPILKN